VNQPPSRYGSHTRAVAGCALGCLVVDVAVLVLVLALGRPLSGFTFFLVLFLPVGIGLAIWGCKTMIAAAQAEVFVPELAPSAVPLGGTVQCTLRVMPHTRFPVGDVEFVLQMDEHAISRGGTSNTHYHNRVPMDKKVLTAGFEAQPGVAIELTENLTVPLTAPPSWGGRNNSFMWSVEVHIAVPGIRPDINQSIPLTVRAETVAHA